MGLAILVWLTLPAQAGIVHGIVLEQSTSRPLARTEVRLLRVGSSGDAAPIARAMTNLAGQYWFPSLPNGVYLLSSSRLGFQTAVYGQKRPTGPGMPILVEGESNLFAEIKMFRLGGITGELGRTFIRSMLGRLDIAWAANGYTETDVDDVAEMSLRTLQSLILDGDSRSTSDLRIFLDRWLGNAIRALPADS